MTRYLHLLFFLGLAGCTQDSARRPGTPTSRPPITHAPSDGDLRTASVLASPAAAALTGRAVGPYALVRDAHALAQLWPRNGGLARSVDFTTTNVLALRVYNEISAEASAPRVIARRGATFITLQPGLGPARATARDRIVLYRIPVDGGPVRYIAYGSTAQTRP